MTKIFCVGSVRSELPLVMLFGMNLRRNISKNLKRTLVGVDLKSFCLKKISDQTMK